MSSGTRPLRVALVAGTLARGGAEKQFVYAARALRDAGVEVRTFALTRGEAHEAELADHALAPDWIGGNANPLARAIVLAARFRTWRPDVVQAGHFYVNLHVTIAAAAAGALSLGSVRSDGLRDVASTGLFGRASLRAPRGLIANSHAARANAVRLGCAAGRVLVVPNVIDLAAFDAHPAVSGTGRPQDGGFVVVALARLVPPKRLDRFVRALAVARAAVPAISGRIIGGGPERTSLERLAADLGLAPQALQFLGERADVPALLAGADALALTSDQEGFPNVLLEAMAARLPVISTAAGDSARVVVDGETGFIVRSAEPIELAARLVELARDSALARRMGLAGRGRVEREYSAGALGPALRAAYASAQPWAPRRVRGLLA